MGGVGVAGLDLGSRSIELTVLRDGGVRLASGGVEVLVCGTCQGFFGLAEHKRVGETTNMLDVVTSLGLAGKVFQI